MNDDVVFVNPDTYIYLMMDLYNVSRKEAERLLKQKLEEQNEPS